ncbi:putative N-acetylglucosamine-6-phosphate deacetylase [Tyrophagus putrescentiae]|nr:putative N-acetylglucosamine-6-phosphate deacetylase [Tyrophagus putrescentiae]
MPVFHHRDPGLLGLLTIYYGIIADGIHTHYSALRLAYHANRTGMVLVSDAISACGLSTGIHMIGTQRVEIKDNRAYVAGTDTLCGAIALLDHCVKNLYHSVDGCSVVEAIDCATLHPARTLGIEDRKGTLNFGADADFVLLDRVRRWTCWPPLSTGGWSL